MSGLSNARQVLVNAIGAVDFGMSVRVYSAPSGTFATPCVRVHPASPWLAPSSLAKGRRTQRWEVWVVIGKLDARSEWEGMEVMVSEITKALDTLPEWSAIVWERPAPTDMGGALYLAVRGIIETIAEV